LFGGLGRQGRIDPGNLTGGFIQADQPVTPVAQDVFLAFDLGQTFLRGRLLLAAKLQTVWQGFKVAFLKGEDLGAACGQFLIQPGDGFGKEL